MRVDKYKCSLTKEEKQRDRDCKECERFHIETDCECAYLNRGVTEQFLVQGLKDEIDSLLARVKQIKSEKYGEWIDVTIVDIRGDDISSYNGYKCNLCLQNEQKRSQYCPTCGAKMQK